jgi:hypothetical protein
MPEAGRWSKDYWFLRESLALKTDLTTHPTWRSDYEQQFAAWLNKEEIRWKYESYWFVFGGQSSYTPDFFLPDQLAFIETKGVWSIGQKKKLKLLKETYPHVNLLVVPYTSFDPDWQGRVLR